MRKTLAFLLGFSVGFMKLFSSRSDVGGVVNKLTKATEEDRYRWHKISDFIYGTYYPNEIYFLEVFPDKELKLFVSGPVDSLFARGNDLLVELLQAIVDQLRRENPDDELIRLFGTR